MFGRKQKEKTEEAEAVSVAVIPSEFYAGASPVIQFAAPTHKNKPVARPPAAAAPTRPPAQPAPATARANGVLANKTFLLGAALGLFILFVAGASWYYYKQYTQPPTPSIPAVNPPTIITQAPSSVPEIPVPVTSTVETVQADTSTPLTLEGGALEFPDMQLGTSADTDNDGLPDVEEELYKTTASQVDTDADGFADGQELKNLYSPIDKAPTKLIDSGLVTEFTNPVIGYNVYYPSSWAVGHVTADYSDVLFNTLTGERVEVRSFSTTTASFADWFARWAPQEQIRNYVPFASRVGVSGYVRSDKRAYIYWSTTHVYTLIYSPGGEQIMHYPLTVQMMANSFVPPGATINLNPVDDQRPIEEELPRPAVGTTTSLREPSRL